MNSITNKIMKLMEIPEISQLYCGIGTGALTGIKPIA
jgi:hypothetical protein